LINIKVGTVAELDLWYRKYSEDLITVFRSNGSVEGSQMTAATEPTSHLKSFRLLNMESSRARIRDSETVIVILVFVDIIICEIGDSDVKTANISIRKEPQSFRCILTWEG
jgi:hypothetical protein